MVLLLEMWYLRPCSHSPGPKLWVTCADVGLFHASVIMKDKRLVTKLFSLLILY